MKLYQDEFHPTTLDDAKRYYAGIISTYFASGLSVDEIVAKGHNRNLVEQVARTIPVARPTRVCMTCGGTGTIVTRWGNDGCSPDEDTCTSCRGAGRIRVTPDTTPASA